MRLTLQVGAVLGTDINDAFADASHLARSMDLSWVAFDFNGEKCTAYSDDRGIIFQEHKPVGSWTRKGGVERV